VIGALREGGPAWTAGVREGDRFTVAQGKPIENWHGLVDVLEAADTTRAVTIGFVRATDHAHYDVAIPAGATADWMAGLEPEGLRAIAGAVSPGMPAYRAGVKEGDRFVAIDGKPVRWFHEIHEQLKGRADQRIVFTLERDGHTFDLAITPMRADPDHPDSPDGQIGVMAPRAMVYTTRVSFPEAFKTSFAQTGSMVVGVFRNLWLTITRPMYYKGSVGGPILIGQMARESAKQGLDSFLWLLAMINLAIMAFNLLPVPLLDGGHILLAVIEGVRRRPVSGNAYINFQKVGLILVGALFLFIFSQDLMRPILRARAVEQAPRESTTVAPPSHRVRPGPARVLTALLILVTWPVAVAAQDDGELPEQLRVIAGVRFEGLHHLRAKDLRASNLKTRGPGRLPWAEKPSLRLDYLRADTAAIVATYRHYGFLDARARWRFQSTRDPAAVKVVFVIEEGPRTRIAQVALEGVTEFHDRELRRVLLARPPEPFDPAFLPLDTLRLSALYQERGRRPHTVPSAVRDSLDSTRVAVRYEIHEGPRYRIGRVDIENIGGLREMLARRELLLRPGTCSVAADWRSPRSVSMTRGSIVRSRSRRCRTRPRRRSISPIASRHAARVGWTSVSAPVPRNCSGSRGVGAPQSRYARAARVARG
jgi:regulator of sigma E protease